MVVKGLVSSSMPCAYRLLVGLAYTVSWPMKTAITKFDEEPTFARNAG